MPTLPDWTIKPVAAPPVFKMSPPALDWPVEPIFKGVETLPNGGATVGSVQARTR
ncbi:hypothetical protein KKA96_02210 [Patescibacteria group bacterium]|nr:hypothetical protein [Patescibacteria group bacterium]